MSDKDKRTEDFDKAPDEIVEETMQEIYDEIQASREKEETNTEEHLPEAEFDVFDDDGFEDGFQEEFGDETEEEDEVFDKPEENEVFDESEEEDLEEEDVYYEEDLEDDGDDSLSDDDDVFEKIEEDSGLKKHRRKKKALIAVACILGVLVLAYLGTAFYFNSHFYFNTHINGTDFSAQSVEQVQTFMEEQVSDYTMKLKESDGGTEEIKGADISLKYVKGKELDKLMKSQNPLLWIRALWEQPDIEAPVGVEFNTEQLNTVIEGLECMKPENQKESVSAYPEFKDTEFVVKEEVVGTQIDAEKFSEAVRTAIGGFNTELDMKEAGCYIVPKFTKESKEVIAAKDAMNSYLGANITYDFSPNTEVVDASVISQWVTIDGDMNVTFNEDAVREYIQGLANKYNTYGKTRTITTGSGNTVNVEGGNYGWVIDKDAEYEALTNNIKNAETVTREPSYSSRAANHSANDFGNTYVEIDLTNQHMWFYKDGQCVVESDIVTGNPNKGNGTPQGTYSLAYKARNQVLRGKKMEDGTYEYESPVDYWMPFNGGIGLHDASWQSAFGGSRFQTYGSHGCVNLPPSVAASLYGYMEAGMPVICHY